MKVVFLDVDGVLNSEEYDRVLTEEYGTAPLGLWGMESGPKYVPEVIGWDPEAVRLLRNVVEETGARIVMSTSWRARFRERHFRKMFAAYGWPDAPVIGCTPMKLDNHFRGNEVDWWLQDNPEVDSWVVVDDSQDFHELQLHRCVFTDMKFGLRKEDAERMKEVLAG